jgi:hypothetical protein
MKNSIRFYNLVKELREQKMDSLANTIEQSMKDCPDFLQEETTDEEFKDIMLAYLSRLTPENFDHLVSWDSSRIADQELEQSNIVYQAKMVSKKLAMVASVAVVILN